ncbi:unnamed protein product [Medioppia subpectinata]|uniref:Concentrative nucleoside transporter C-terminal domain-containing protein n=1 Tax=Medioppia subpectinata TaxID=1979941 RepID=A0A7R9PXF7_9ACAR|nr:unnamed protein product [Medioppia subpectinata]CAG2104340.1 unnamed protein product [Medioppia subpectinata]
MTGGFATIAGSVMAAYINFGVSAIHLFWDECESVATLIGLKTVINEFVAYQELGEMIKLNNLSKRAQLISTYALCGFSNFGSIGIQLGGLGSMAPERKADLSSMALRAMIAGSISCFMTACIAGLLVADNACTQC